NSQAGTASPLAPGLTSGSDEAAPGRGPARRRHGAKPRPIGRIICSRAGGLSAGDSPGGDGAPAPALRHGRLASTMDLELSIPCPHSWQIQAAFNLSLQLHAPSPDSAPSSAQHANV